MSRIRPVFHVSLLEPYSARKSFQPLSQPIQIEDEYEYEVERILDERTQKVGRRNVTQYLVKWTGYGHDHNSWEPATNLTHCNELLQEYERVQSLVMPRRLPVGRRRQQRPY